MLRPFLITTIIGLVTTLSGGSADAMVVIDQQNAEVDTNYIASFGQVDLAQSFTPSLDNSVGAGIFLYDGTGSANITIGLWSGLGAGGTKLASGTTAASVSSGWVDVSWSQVPVTPGSTYYLVFTSDNPSYGIAGTLENAYAGGELFANSDYTPYPSDDFTFQESADYLPEPASLAMLGAGLAGLGAIRRKRA